MWLDGYPCHYWVSRAAATNVAPAVFLWWIHSFFSLRWIVDFSLANKRSRPLSVYVAPLSHSDYGCWTAVVKRPDCRWTFSSTTSLFSFDAAILVGTAWLKLHDTDYPGPSATFSIRSTLPPPILFTSSSLSFICHQPGELKGSHCATSCSFLFKPGVKSFWARERLRRNFECFVPASVAAGHFSHLWFWGRLTFHRFWLRCLNCF